MNPRRDWTLCIGADENPVEPRPHLACTRCGERLVTELPMRGALYVAVTRAFVKLHRSCLPTTPDHHTP